MYMHRIYVCIYLFPPTPCTSTTSPVGALALSTQVICCTLAIIITQTHEVHPLHCILTVVARFYCVSEVNICTSVASEAFSSFFPFSGYSGVCVVSEYVSM